MRTYKYKTGGVLFFAIIAMAFGVFWFFMAKSMIANWSDRPFFLEYFPYLGLIVSALSLLIFITNCVRLHHKNLCLKKGKLSPGVVVGGNTITHYQNGASSKERYVRIKYKNKAGKEFVAKVMVSKRIYKQYLKYDGYVPMMVYCNYGYPDLKKKLDDYNNSLSQARSVPTSRQNACPSCGCGVDYGNKFCPECGASMVSKPKGFCPECGGKIEPGQKFCPGCGNKL